MGDVLILSHVYRTLIINPSELVTKIAVFDNEICIFERAIVHRSNDISHYHDIIEQVDFRKQKILHHLDYEGINISKLTAICARGGLLKPIEGGTYKVNEEMIKDLRDARNGVHPSNLGAIIAKQIADNLNIDAFIVDPVVVDELDEVARYSGIPNVPRKSIFHALNHKAAARRAAEELNKNYEELTLIVAHMALGMTIGAHKKGRVIDVNNGLDGEGPFTPVRAGTVPVGGLIKLCFNEQSSYQEMIDKVVGASGLKAYIQSTDIRAIEHQIKQGNNEMRKVYEAMAYQICKEIGAMSTVVSGKIDAIVLTGELANGPLLVQMISERINWIADIFVFPGVDELIALNEGTLRVLMGKECVKEYPMKHVTKEL